MSNSVKARRQNIPVYTSRDAARDAMHNEYLREVAALKSKVKHWEKQVAKFGGEIQIATLEKFKAQLAAI